MACTSPYSPSSFASQLGSQAKTSGGWRLSKTTEHKRASSHVLRRCLWWMRSLWHFPTVFGGDIATEGATGEGKQHVPKEMRATGSGGNQETFGINQCKALHPERGNKHHRCVMNRMSPKQQHPMQESKLTLVFLILLWYDRFPSKYYNCAGESWEARLWGWGKENCQRVFEVRSGLTTTVITNAQQTLSCIAVLNNFQQFIINQVLCKH